MDPWEQEAQNVTSNSGGTSVQELPSARPQTSGGWAAGPPTVIRGNAQGVTASQGPDPWETEAAQQGLHSAMQSGGDLTPYLRRLDQLGFQVPSVPAGSEEQAPQAGALHGGQQPQISPSQYFAQHPGMDPLAVEQAFQALNGGPSIDKALTPQQERAIMTAQHGFVENASNALDAGLARKFEGMVGAVDPGAAEYWRQRSDAAYGPQTGAGGAVGEQAANLLNAPNAMHPLGWAASAASAFGNERTDVNEERAAGKNVSFGAEMLRSGLTAGLDLGQNVLLNKFGGKIFAGLASAAGKTATQVLWAYARKFGIDAVSNEALVHAGIAGQNLIDGKPIWHGMGVGSLVDGVVQTAAQLIFHAVAQHVAGGGGPDAAEADARKVLGLGPKDPLTLDAVNDAYRTAAKAVHAEGAGTLQPGDPGYDAWQARMQQTAEAAARLRGRAGPEPAQPQTPPQTPPPASPPAGTVPEPTEPNPAAPAAVPPVPARLPEGTKLVERATTKINGVPHDLVELPDGTQKLVPSGMFGAAPAPTTPRGLPAPQGPPSTEELLRQAAELRAGQDDQLERANQVAPPGTPTAAGEQAARPESFPPGADRPFSADEQAMRPAVQGAERGDRRALRVPAEASEEDILGRHYEMLGLRGKLARGELSGADKTAAQKRVDQLAGIIQDKLDRFGQAHGEDAQEQLIEKVHKAQERRGPELAGTQGTPSLAGAPGGAQTAGHEQQHQVSKASSSGTVDQGKRQVRQEPGGRGGHAEDQPQAADDQGQGRPGAQGHARDAELALSPRQRELQSAIDELSGLPEFKERGKAGEAVRDKIGVLKLMLEHETRRLAASGSSGTVEAAPPSAVKPGLYGQSTIDSSGVGPQRPMFHQPAAGPEAPKPEFSNFRPEGTPSMFPTRAGTGGGPVPGTTANVPIEQLSADPTRFQYKSGTDTKSGTTTLLKGVKHFDPSLAGVIAVWHEPDAGGGAGVGKTWVVNGHHRYELARRSGATRMNVMYLAVKTAPEARAAGALINMAEGRGTAIDAARFLRDSGLSSADLEKAGLSLAEKKVADGVALAKLDALLWKMTLTGELAESRAVAIADAVPDHAQQRGLADLIARQEKKGVKLGVDEIAELARFVKAAPTADREEASLFGVEHVKQSLAVEKARLAAWIKRQMRRDKRLFGTVARAGNALALSKAGNVIDTGASEKISREAAEAEFVFDKLATSKGPIASALNHAASALAGGKDFNDVAESLETAVRAAVSQIDAGGQAAGGRGDAAGAQDAGRAADQRAVEADRRGASASSGTVGTEKAAGGNGEPAPAPAELRAVDEPGSPRAGAGNDGGDAGPAGETAVVPWSSARSGRPATLAGFHGGGRQSRQSAYNIEGSPPILGDALYLADTEKHAGTYGPDVTRRTVRLDNPLVLDDDGPWRELARAAGVSPNPIDFTPGGAQRMQASVRKLRAAIEQRGHDGVIVRLTNPAEGDETKLLGKLFGHDQVVAFNGQDAQAAAADWSWLNSGTSGTAVGQRARPLESHASPASVEAKVNPPGAARIRVDPLPGGDPRKLKQIILDLGRAAGKKVRNPSRLGRRMGGAYSPDSTRTAVRFEGDLDTTAHEIGHVMDDRHGVVAAWAKNRLRSPFDAELMPDFSGYGSVTKTGPNSKLDYQRGEGVAEWVRAWLVNPAAAQAAAPKFSQWFQQKVGPADLAALRAFGDDVRRWAGLPAADKAASNIRFAGDDGPPLIRRIADFITGGNQPGLQMNVWDRFVTTFLDDLRPVVKGLDEVRDLRPLVNFASPPRVGAGTRLQPPAADLALAQLRSFAGENPKLREILRNGPIRYEPTNPDNAIERAPGIGGGTDWLLGQGIAGVGSGSSGTVEGLEELHRKAAVYLDGERVMEKAALIRKEAEQMAQTLEDRLNQHAAGEGRGPLPLELKKLARAQKRVRDRAEARIERLAGWGGGVYSDEAVAKAALEEIAADPQLHQNVRELAGRYRAWATASLRYMVDGGRLSEKSYGQIVAANQFYSAFHRVIEPVLGFPQFRHGRGKLGSVSQPLARFKGSTRQLDDPYVSLLRQTAAIVRETDRNAALDAFADLLRSSRGMHEDEPVDLDFVGSLARAGDAEAITVYHQGEKEQWQFAPDVHRALKGFGDTPDQALALKLVSLIVKKIPQAAVATYNPLFWMRQAFRMAGHLGAYSQSGANPLDVLRPGTGAQQRTMRAYGGDLGAGPASSIEDWRKLVDKELHRLATDQSTVLAIPAQAARSLHEASLNLSGGMSRAAEFRRALAKHRAEGYSSADAARLAAHDARSLIDYAIAGRVVRSLDRYVMFMNAGIQHAARLPRAAAKNPWGTLARFALFALAPALAAYLWNSRDRKLLDEWRQLPAWRRDFGLNFKVGHLWWTIPMPYEQGAAAHFFIRMIDRMVHGPAARAFEGYGQSLMHGAVHVDEAAAMGGPVHTIRELQANHSDYFGRSIIPPEDEGKDLSLRRGTSHASRLAQILQELTDKAGMGVDARKIDYFLGQTFGGGEHVLAALSDLGRADKPSLSNLETSASGIGSYPPGFTARDVQWVLDEAHRLGDDQAKPMQRFGAMLHEEASAPTVAERDQLAVQVRDEAGKLRGFYERYGPSLLAARQAQEKLSEASAVEGTLKRLGTGNDALAFSRKHAAELGAAQDADILKGDIQRTLTRISDTAADESLSDRQRQHDLDALEKDLRAATAAALRKAA